MRLVWINKRDKKANWCIDGKFNPRYVNMLRRGATDVNGYIREHWLLPELCPLLCQGRAFPWTRLSRDIDFINLAGVPCKGDVPSPSPLYRRRTVESIDSRLKWKTKTHKVMKIRSAITDMKNWYWKSLNIQRATRNDEKRGTLATLSLHQTPSFLLTVVNLTQAATMTNRDSPSGTLSAFSRDQRARYFPFVPKDFTFLLYCSIESVSIRNLCKTDSTAVNYPSYIAFHDKHTYKYTYTSSYFTIEEDEKNRLDLQLLWQLRQWRGATKPFKFPFAPR